MSMKIDDVAMVDTSKAMTAAEIIEFLAPIAIDPEKSHGTYLLFGVCDDGVVLVTKKRACPPRTS